MNNRRLMAHLLLAVAYVVSGKLGLMLALPPGYASPIFPPAGIAVAAAFIGGRRVLPWVFLGSLLLNIWAGYSASQQINIMGLTVASVIAIASMLQAALGGWWLRRVIGYPASFDRGYDILRFLLLAPAICLTSASLSVSGLSALGIFDTASFATNWAAWWVGDTLGVVVMLPLVMIAAGEPRALWRSRARTVAIPMLLISALFVAIFLKANRWEQNDSLTEFRQLSQQAINRVQNKLEEQESVLEQTAALFIHHADSHVTREEFHRFVEKSLKRFPMIQTLEWASPVDAAHRASFEAAQRKDVPGFEIRERNAAGQLQRAGQRNSFYPVTYVEPLVGNEATLGFDLASTHEDQANLAKAVKRGTTATSATVHSVQQRQQQAEVLLLLAVNPHDHKSGVVLTILRIGDFMDRLLLDTRPMLYTRLVDLDEQKTIYDNFVPGTRHALYEHTFNFGTCQYRLETAPTPAYLMQHHGWQSWSVLAAGLLGAGLFGALLLLGTGYAARVEAQVKGRTRELKESESRFRNTMENAPIGMGLASLDGNFVQVNHALCTILGYEKEELEKLTFREITHPDDVASTLASVQRLLDGEINSYRLEKRYIRKDGSAVWAQLTASIERDDSGTPLYFIGQIEDITERKQTSEAQHALIEKIKDLYNNAPCGYHSLDKDGVIIMINDTELAWLGYARDEVAGKIKWSDLLTPESIHTFRENFPRLKKEGFIRDLEIEIIRKDGTVFTTLVNATAIYDSGGNFETSRSTLFDITDRKQAVDALRESESRYRLLVESSPFCIHEIDLEGRLLSMNRAGLGMLCLDDADQIRGMPYLGAVNQKDAGRVGALLQDAITNGIPSHFEFVSSGDALRYFKSCFIPIEDTGGKVLKLMGITEDIAERKLAERALSESETRFRNLVETTSDWIWEVDENIVFTYVSPKIYDILGYEAAEIIGKTPFDLMLPEEAKRVADIVGTIAAMKKPFLNLENTNLHRNGYQVVIETSGVPVIDTEGKFNGYRGINRDITERKEFEEELKRSNAELEQFSYAVSHDMRQPLRMISSYLQLLEKSLSGQLDNEKRDYFGFAVEGAKRIDQMLVALLEYSRMGRMGEPPTWIDSRAVLDEALQFLQPAIAEAQAELDISGDWPRIFASHDEMLRLLQNLIGNATKFRVAGRTPKISVTSKIDKNGWCLCVADNGVGIIPDQIKRLFQVFQRLQLRTTYEGNGVGLALCRKIAEHHKGRIWAESAGEGHGSKFCVTLPVLREKK